MDQSNQQLSFWPCRIQAPCEHKGYHLQSDGSCTPPSFSVPFSLSPRFHSLIKRQHVNLGSRGLRFLKDEPISCAHEPKEHVWNLVLSPALDSWLFQEMELHLACVFTCWSVYRKRHNSLQKTVFKRGEGQTRHGSPFWDFYLCGGNTPRSLFQGQLFNPNPQPNNFCWLPKALMVPPVTILCCFWYWLSSGSKSEGNYYAFQHDLTRE